MELVVSGRPEHREYVHDTRYGSAKRWKPSTEKYFSPKKKTLATAYDRFPSAMIAFHGAIYSTVASTGVAVVQNGDFDGIPVTETNV